jgi:FMN reductase
MTDETDRTVVVVVGNPQAASRTGHAAVLVAARLAALAGIERPPVLIDLADHGSALLGWGDPEVAALKVSVLGAHALVVATPTYKASYTGLLKLFLDQFDKGALGAKPTVALMTGASPAHSLAVEVHLAPVLVEIGASLPAAGIYLAGPEIDDPAPPLTVWFERHGGPLRRALGP